MKKIVGIAAFAILSAMSLSAFAAEKENNSQEIVSPRVKVYGFVRNFMAFDTRESKAGTLDLFYYVPKDRDLNANGEDMNARPSFRLFALTTRLGFDLLDYQVGNTKIGGKIETDFYSMNGTVATSRMRQAYIKMNWDKLGQKGNSFVDLRIGQMWHPMAADQPICVNLETGSPFNPFSRSPAVMLEYGVSRNFSLTGALIYQMQYVSEGPNGKSADYLKYSMVPEGYFGINFKTGGFLARAGVDVLSIKPRWKADVGGTAVNVKDRLTTVSPYLYAQYTDKYFQLKAKTVLASGGEHFNMMSGYGVSSVSDPENWEYTYMKSTASFISASYGKKFQVICMLGYVKNLGTDKPLYSDLAGGLTSKNYYYFSGNGYRNVNSIVRATPTFAYNLGKLTLALEYDATAVEYGDFKEADAVNSSDGLVTDNLHWVLNNRLLLMAKFTF